MIGILCHKSTCQACKYDGPIERIVVDWYQSEEGDWSIGPSYPCIVNGVQSQCGDTVEHRIDEVLDVMSKYDLEDFLLPIDGPQTIHQLLRARYGVGTLNQLTYKAKWIYSSQTQCRSCGIVSNVEPSWKQCPKCFKDMTHVYIKDYKKSGYVKKRVKK